jgi:cell division protein FtsI/penicillin-binding protein 2
VIRDRRGRIVEDCGGPRAPRDGEAVALAIDQRLQFLAHRELKRAVEANRAKAGSLVILDARTGEVLALVNQPDYNPNNRAASPGARRATARDRPVRAGLDDEALHRRLRPRRRDREAHHDDRDRPMKIGGWTLNDSHRWARSRCRR